MYSTKLFNKNAVDNNAYITVNDPYIGQVANPFRQGKKGEKLTPFQCKVCCAFHIFTAVAYYFPTTLSYNELLYPLNTIYHLVYFPWGIVYINCR